MIHRLKSDRVVLLPVKGHSDECRRAGIMLFGVIELHTRHAVYVFDLIGHLIGLVIGNIGQHKLSAAQRREFLFHEGQSPSGLGIRRQVRGDIIIDMHLTDRGRAEQDCCQKDQIEGFALIDDKSCEFEHKVFGFTFFRHVRPTFPGEKSRLLPRCIFDTAL